MGLVNLTVKMGYSHYKLTREVERSARYIKPWSNHMRISSLFALPAAQAIIIASILVIIGVACQYLASYNILLGWARYIHQACTRMG